MTQHILIVDSNKAFATILKEGIETENDYQATVVTTALEARNEANRGHFSLAIVDLGLEDQDPAELLGTLRERLPELRLMVIPVDDIPERVTAIGIQGTLSKPFFLPDIPAQIEDALSLPLDLPLTKPVTDSENDQVSDPAPDLEESTETADEFESSPSETPPSTALLDHLARESRRLSNHLRQLSHELNADAVFLTCGSELVTYVGHFNETEAQKLSRLVTESWLASARVADVLGLKEAPFEQSLHESKDYLLYSLAATHGVVLSVALRAGRPLGMIRYNTRQTVQALRPILLPR